MASLRKIFTETFKNWVKDDPFTLSSATAYYAIFSIPGLMVMLMAIASIFFEQAHVEAELLGHVENTLGSETAYSIAEAMDNTNLENPGPWAMIVGLVTLFFGATGLFVQLQRGLNRIWEVQVKKSAGVIKFLKNRFISFSMIVVIGFLLLVSLVLTATLNFMGEWLATHVSPVILSAMAGADLIISLSVITVLFATIFKVLPDAKVEWKYALRGGLLSAILFNIGEYALNIYFQLAEPETSFGAAGSLILLMIWVFYSCMILLMGAEFTKTYAEIDKGKKAEATDIAKKKIREKESEPSVIDIVSK